MSPRSTDADELPRPARLRTALTLTSVLVVAAGVASEVAKAVYRLPSDYGFVPYFSLSYEANFPTWYSSVLLLACAALLALAARAPRADTDPKGAPWWILAAGFTFMSLDEVMSLHELTGTLVRAHGVLHFSWVIPALVLVGALGLYFIPFLKALPPKTRNRFVAAGAVYVFGAVGMELPLGYWVERYGDSGLGYGLIDALEEALEILGAQLFLLALLDHVRARGLRLRFESI
ncbi:MAG: hypothetical protein U0271_12355 [Polyangiaceae bacterium]